MVHPFHSWTGYKRCFLLAIHTRHKISTQSPCPMRVPTAHLLVGPIGWSILLRSIQCNTGTLLTTALPYPITSLTRYVMRVCVCYWNAWALIQLICSQDRKHGMIMPSSFFLMRCIFLQACDWYGHSNNGALPKTFCQYIVYTRPIHHLVHILDRYQWYKSISWMERHVHIGWSSHGAISSFAGKTKEKERRCAM